MHEFRRIATHKPIFCQLFINKRKPQTAFHILSRPKSLSEYIVRSQLAVRGSVDCYLYTIHVRDNTPQLRNAILFSAQHVESYAYTNTLDMHLVRQRILCKSNHRCTFSLLPAVIGGRKWWHHVIRWKHMVFVFALWWIEVPIIVCI